MNDLQPQPSLNFDQYAGQVFTEPEKLKGGVLFFEGLHHFNSGQYSDVLFLPVGTYDTNDKGQDVPPEYVGFFINQELLWKGQRNVPLRDIVSGKGDLNALESMKDIFPRFGGIQHAKQFFLLMKDEAAEIHIDESSKMAVYHVSDYDQVAKTFQEKYQPAVCFLGVETVPYDQISKGLGQGRIKLCPPILEDVLNVEPEKMAEFAQQKMLEAGAGTSLINRSIEAPEYLH